ncbi:hypothetical protein ACU686_29355 [Yinghuangia aomiensis]
MLVEVLTDPGSSAPAAPVGEPCATERGVRARRAGSRGAGRDRRDVPGRRYGLRARQRLVPAPPRRAPADPDRRPSRTPAPRLPRRRGRGDRRPARRPLRPGPARRPHRIGDRGAGRRRPPRPSRAGHRRGPGAPRCRGARRRGSGRREHAAGARPAAAAADAMCGSAPLPGAHTIALLDGGAGPLPDPPTAVRIMEQAGVHGLLAHMRADEARRDVPHAPFGAVLLRPR